MLCFFCGGRKTEEAGVKLRGKTKMNNKHNLSTEPSRRRTRATMVGGERSHDCVIPASEMKLRLITNVRTVASQLTKVRLPLFKFYIIVIYHFINNLINNNCLFVFLWLTSVTNVPYVRMQKSVSSLYVGRQHLSNN